MALKINHNVDLSKRCTLRLGGHAAAEVVLSVEEDLVDLDAVIKNIGCRAVVVGRGSNLLFGHGDLDLTLLRPKFAQEPVIEGQTENGLTLVRLGAGVPLGRLVMWAESQSLGGLCGLAGIPGDVGGSLAGNAGSYGCELGSAVHALTLWHEKRGVITLHKDDFDIAYRRFAPKTQAGLENGAWMIVSATFALPKADAMVLYAKRREALANKKASQPLRVPSAGSCFKNPVEGPAWKFLSQAGFRGKRIAGVGFSEMHANFLVNDGQGSSQAAFDIIAKAQEAVLAQSGVRLEMEVKVMA